MIATITAQTKHLSASTDTSEKYMEVLNAIAAAIGWIVVLAALIGILVPDWNFWIFFGSDKFVKDQMAKKLANTEE